MNTDRKLSAASIWRPLLVCVVTALAAALALLGPAPADEQVVKENGKPAKVPFSMLPSNHMLVRAMINDKGPYRLIFDLGAPITLLSNNASETSGVVKDDAPKSFLFSMRGEAEVAKLRVGDLTAEKLPVVVFDHPALKILGDVLGRPIDGIIGFTFFARYKTTIDYQINQMTFEPVDFEVRDLMKDLPARLSGPKTARRKVLAPGALWGLRLSPVANGADGVPVAEVLADSPALAAGLKPGDVLTSIDDRWTSSIHDVFAAAADVAPGQAVAVVVRRDGKELVLTLRPEDGA
ncbi:MAG: PDZ domain-containing protein [Paludisphaera borealis]|uniref:PDZ domain-containing protein n=1 Tax=Paludisphaera borealis TaxID=1387353 RepID=UPI002847D8E0|nr:PDZ domain-containing protein [Paludisphaera borealis]MDR3619570.1 PDZ domain-containing protein [Paludisphaera borealis]